MTTRPGSKYFSKGIKRTALSVALGVCVAGGVHAQSTTGNIHGTVPAGTTVTIANKSGLTRTVTADAQGRYYAGSLPIGNYTVTAEGLGKQDVTVTVGAATDVSFGSATTLETVTVTGASVPKIDVTATDTRTVITAEQLKRLPLARSAEAIALLAPGAVTGNGTYFGSQVAFGGSSVAENAYYLNGYFSGNPITNVGGFTLPYGSIEQQETYTGGYGAKYGRSDGGVISQVGKSGTNDLHFGGQIVFKPKGLTEERPDRYFNPPALPAGGTASDGYEYEYVYDSPELVGTLYDKGENRKSWETTYSGYISGPLIKDRLFAFVSAETTLGHTTTPPASPDSGAAQLGSKTSSEDPKIYAKLNWNINDNNLLEYTYVSEKYSSHGGIYDYDWDSQTFDSYNQPATSVKDNTEFSILKYTGYLTDNLTLSGTYGRSRNRYNTDPYLTGEPYIASWSLRDKSVPGSESTTSPSSQSTYRATKETNDYTDGLRLELEWVLGDHTLSFGIDNTKLEGKNEGTSQVADYWQYGKAASGAVDLNAPLGVGPAGGDGYYVRQLHYFDTTSMSNKQKAEYIEDKWQITDNFLLSLGVRADKFENFSDTGQKFVDSDIQWEPRIGASWDVFGDSSLKIFGNAGRYFLNMPNSVAIRGVGASTYTWTYYTYTGIDPETGAPTGLTPVLNTDGTAVAGPVSSNGEIGLPKDPLTYVPSDIKSEYQDEYVLGFEKTLGSSWKYGAKATYRELKSAIDDMCDPYTLLDAAGLSIVDYDSPNARFIAEDSGGNLYGSSWCYMFNPGGSNTYAFQQVQDNGGTYSNIDGSYLTAKVASSALGMPDLKRTYKAIDLFLEHPFDGKWEARIDYTYSKSQGNSEGPANSDTGQGSNAHDNGTATSQNWDAWQIMAYADGYLPNDRRHQLKAHASYAFNDEWLVSVSARIASGAPISCFGYYDPDGTIDHTSPEADPIGYYNSYHTCFGASWTPGKTTTPWTHLFDVGVTWKPAYFDHKLAIGLNVFNVSNERTVTSVNAEGEVYGSPYQVGVDSMLPVSYTTPRYVQFSASFDF